MSRLSDFFEILFAEWSGFAGQMDLIEAWNHLILAKYDSPVGQKRDELVNTARNYFKNKGLNYLLSKPINKIEIDAPMFSGDDAARQNFHRYRNASTTIKEPFLLSLVILICMFMDKDAAYFNGFVTEDGDYPFEGVEFPSERIVEQIRVSIGFTNNTYLDKVITEEQFRFPFLLSSLFVFRDEQKKERKATTCDGTEDNNAISEWLLGVFNELNTIAGDKNLIQFHQKYYESLWLACKTLDVRDIVGSKLSSINDNVEISNLYTVPPFSQGGISMDCLINSNKKIKQLIVANTGCGKSTLLQAIVTSNIIGQLLAFNSEYVSSADLTQYQAIKTRLGFEKDYIPILVKAIDINEKTVESILDIAIGHKITGFSENIENLIANHEKNGQVILLVDALDEIAGNKRKEGFAKLIDEFISRHPSVNLIITSRSIDLREFYGAAFYGELERVTLGLLGDPEIKELISKWMLCDVSLATQQDVEKKYQCLINNDYLSELVSNPYMLSHALHYQAYHVNATPQEIISHVIDNLIEKRWPAEEYEKFGITPSFMREILAQIAWEMTESNTHVIPANGIITRFCNAADTIDGDSEIDRKTWAMVVKEMNARAGLLILEDIGYVFQNRIIEYFLASECVISKYVEKLCRSDISETAIIKDISVDFSSIQENYWADVILMMFSPDERHNLHRRDYITPALYKYLLYKSAESVCVEELKVIGYIFVNLVKNTFGRNRITNISNASGVLAREQITRFLHNNQTFLKNIGNWEEEKVFSDVLQELSKKELINYEKENVDNE